MSEEECWAEDDLTPFVYEDYPCPKCQGIEVEWVIAPEEEDD